MRSGGWRGERSQDAVHERDEIGRRPEHRGVDFDDGDTDGDLVEGLAGNDHADGEDGAPDRPVASGR